jgi:hypothetical protein
MGISLNEWIELDKKRQRLQREIECHVEAMTSEDCPVTDKDRQTLVRLCMIAVRDFVNQEPSDCRHGRLDDLERSMQKISGIQTFCRKCAKEII